MCFAGTGLEHIDLPASISDLGGECFYGDHLDSVICRAINVPKITETTFALYLESIGDGPWYPVYNDDCKLYVPAESLEAYKVAEGWKNFKTILPLESITGIKNTSLSGLQFSVNGSELKLSGIAKGTQVQLYSLDGKSIGMATAGQQGLLTFTADEKFVIVRIGNEAIKIAMEKNR